MDRITIYDLEVHYHVGVTEAERSQSQRLLITLEMERDLAAAAKSDSLDDTIDYYAVSRRILGFGDGHRWALIETLAADLAQMALRDFKADRVTVEVKKFIIPEARYVSVGVTRPIA